MSVRRLLLIVALVLVIIASVIVSQPRVKAALLRLLSRSRRGRGAAAAAARKRRRSERSVLYGSADAVSSNRVSDGLPIPNIVHFIFGLEANFGHIKFGLINYLAILGAAMFIHPEEIIWHHRYLPEGIWWECARPHLTFNKVEDVTHVHGKPKAMRVAHKADILRMDIMMNQGGMYLVSGERRRARSARRGVRTFISIGAERRGAPKVVGFAPHWLRASCGASRR